MAADLVRARVALIAAMGNNLPARAAFDATKTIPIVFSMGADPVRLGLVASISRPGGNATGVTLLTSDLMQKRMELLHELVPNAKSFGLLINPANPGIFTASARTSIELARDAVRVWGGTLEVAQARTADDLDGAFSSLAEKRIEALATANDALFLSIRERLVTLASKYSIPAVHHTAEVVLEGGLASYGANFRDAYRQSGLYAGRILKGEKPADLPVLQPTKFELVINITTAKALGLDVPALLLAPADEVIE
jgi:putative tryptophan/tyrosine transport system substrate-binding protein